MALSLLATLMLMALLGSTRCSTMSQMDKALISPKDLLGNVKPIVADFANALTKAVNGSFDMETELNVAINKGLAQQLDQLIAKRNGSLTSGDLLCCQCHRCTVPCTMCATTCCCQGDQGCTCKICSIAAELQFESIGADSSVETRMWAESSKQALRRDVALIVARHSMANERCCACQTCQTFSSTISCGQRLCCIKGTDCICWTCSSTSVDLMADHISNPVTLTSEAAISVAQVDVIIDRLLLFLNYP